MGASGLLGKAVFNRFCKEMAYSEKVSSISWKDIGHPEVGAKPYRLAKYLEENLGDMSETDVIIAGGLIKSEDSEQLLYSNLEFPRNLIHAVWPHPSVRLMTFGTIHERFDDAVSHNAYFMSKYLLGQWVSDFAARHPPSGRLLHIRLHTLYGLPLHPRMFLGQIAEALETGLPFRMSSGEQFREYHHVEDIAECVFRLCQKQWNLGPVLEISSGEAIRLRDLAIAVFREFSREYLLRIGEIPAGEGENKNEIFKRSDSDLLPFSRNPVTGVVDVLREHLEACTVRSSGNTS